MRTRIFRSSAILCLAERREDHDIVIRPLAVEVARQLPLLHEAVAEEDMLRFLVVVEDVDAELEEVHLLEREARQRPDGVGAEAAVPGARLADEEAEPRPARDPFDVMDRGVADGGAVSFRSMAKCRSSGEGFMARS